MLPPIWDPEAMAAEVRRNAAKGCHAVSFSENPSHLKLPSFHDEHWDPFWQACVDEGTIVCLHIGSSSRLVVTARDAPIDVLITLQPINIVQAAADLLWSPVLRKFPDLRVALSEGGIGWIPYFCGRVDWIYTRHHQWTGQDFGGRLPSEVFLERVVLCFIDDPAGLANLDRMDADRVCWESDYPHSDSTWPLSPEMRWVGIEGKSEAVIDKITHQNAMLHFRFDPFALRARETCTVGASRAHASAHHLRPRSVAARLERKTGVADLIGAADKGKR
jgi:predicted TIM-barrel fold metal-dependent hydrolase